MTSPRHPFLLFTAFTVPGVLAGILWLDQPLTLWLHRHARPLRPFFAALTDGADAVHEALMTHLLGIPIIFLLMALSYVVGRWIMRRPGAVFFLAWLLTHELSMVVARVLKGMVHRLRPEVLVGPGYAGSGLWASGPHNDSFPSTHTAVYWSLFFPLALALPRWRLPLLVLPGLISVGRLVLGAHYLSDVWFSVWLVVGFTYLFRELRRVSWL